MKTEKGLDPELLQRILDKSSNALYVVDAGTGEILEVNQKACDMTGRSHDEMLDLHISSIVTHFPETISWSEFIDELHNQPSITLTGEHVRKNGSTFPVQADIDLMRVDGRELVLATVRGLEEREYQRDELVDHYSNYKSLFQYSPVGMLEIDPSEVLSYLQSLQHDHEENFETFLKQNPDLMHECIARIEFLDINQQVLELLDVESEKELIHNLDYFITDQFWNQIVEQAVSLLGGQNEDRVEIRTRTINGEELHLYIDYLLPPDTDEKFSRMFVALLDITEQKAAKRALQQSEERYRTLFEQAKIGMAEVALDESWMRVNPRLQEILGYSESEFYEMDGCNSINHPEDLKRDREKVEKLLDGEIDHFSVEKRYRKKDGEYLWARLTAGLVEPEGDREPYMVSTIEDIDEMKRTKKKLEESQEKFRQLTENINEVFWLTDPKKTEVIYLSPAFEDIWNIPVEAVEEEPDRWLDAVHPEDRDRVKENLVQRQQEGEFDLEYRIVRPDGSIRWIHDRAFPVNDDDGDLKRLAGIAEDITERKQLEEEQEAFFDVSLDLFAIADKNGYFKKVNKAFEEKLGFSEDELTANPYIEYIHPEDREATLEKMDELMNDQSVTNFETRFRTSDGEYRWLNWRSIPVGEHVYAAARDVTERRRREARLKNALDEKEVLLKEIHHRVKNNLQVITSLLNMQKKDVRDESLQKKLDESINRVRTMALIHEKLYQSESLEQIDLGDYLRDLSDYLISLHSFDKEDIPINYELDSQSLDLDRAIPCGLILNELLTNALEYAVNGDQTGEIEIASWVEDSTRILAVDDNGPGLSDRMSNGESSNFGLDLVETLAEYELDGTVSLDGQKGTRVEISFPVNDHGSTTQ